MHRYINYLFYILILPCPQPFMPERGSVVWGVGGRADHSNAEKIYPWLGYLGRC